MTRAERAAAAAERRETREFWRFIRQTAAEVMKWPSWMRGKPNPVRR